MIVRGRVPCTSCYFTAPHLFSALKLPARFAWLSSPYTLLTLTAFFWAVNWILARHIRHEVGPNALALGRWLAAALIVWPIAWPRVKRDWPVIKANFPVLIVLSITGAGGYNALSYAGVRSTTALNGMLLNATVPFFILALSTIFLREKMRLNQVIGLLLSFVGALWIIGEGTPARILQLQFNHGDILVLTAMLSWAVYTIVIRKKPIAIDLLSFITVLSVIALMSLIPLTLIELQTIPAHISGKSLAIFLYMGLGPSVLCYIFWNKGVAEIGPARTGLFLYLVPVFGSMLSSWVLGEHLALFHVVGFALVLIGLFISNRNA
jgi:drug/metabolite transporter (DMT)-like permease